MDWPELHRQARACLEEIGAECDVQEELGRLSAGQTQMVQIAAALATGARILVMDEPTSSLSAAESRTTGKIDRPASADAERPSSTCRIAWTRYFAFATP